MYPERIDINAKLPEVSNSVRENVRVKFVGGEKEKTVLVRIKKEPPSHLDSDSLTVYELFKEEPLHADEISAVCGLPTARVLSALMMLEIEGLIEATEGKCYQLV